MDQAAAPVNVPQAPYSRINQTRMRQGTLWLFFLTLTALLLSVFSAGFFLYTAVIVTGLLLLSVTLASLSITGLEIHRNVSAVEIHLGEKADVWLTIHNRKSFPAFWIFRRDHIEPGLDVEGPVCQYTSISADSHENLKYTLHSTRRGLFAVGPAVAEASGPFGLVRRFLVGSQVDFITVLPKVVPIGKGLAQGRRPIHQVPSRRSIFEDPSRFIGMRDYRPGDSMRRIHWRATARSGKIQVKLFEPAVLTGVMIAVDMNPAAYPATRSQPDQIDHLLELTITAAASLGQYVLAGDQEVGLISNGTDAALAYPDQWSGGTFQRLDQALEKTHLKTRAAAYQPVTVEPGKGRQEQLQNALARLLPSPGVELADLLLMELPRLPRNLVLMVITPQPNIALFNTLESLRRSGIETGLIRTRLPQADLPQTDPGVIGRVPDNIPVYLIQEESDLEELGGRTL